MRSLQKMAAVLALAALAGPALAQTAEAPPKAAACVACHGPNGNAPQGAFPILAGQTSRYLYLQLRDYKEGRRTDPVMSPMAADLTKDEMRALADWFSKQKPAQQAFKVDPEKARLGKLKSDETLCTMCHLGGWRARTTFRAWPARTTTTPSSSSPPSRTGRAPTTRAT